MKARKNVVIMVLIAILLLGVVSAWTYQKVGDVFVVTLDSGNKVNVTNISLDRQNNHISAVVVADKLSIQDAVQIQNISQGIQDQLDKKKNSYNLTVIIQR